MWTAPKYSPLQVGVWAWNYKHGVHNEFLVFYSKRWKRITIILRVMLSFMLILIIMIVMLTVVKLSLFHLLGFTKTSLLSSISGKNKHPTMIVPGSRPSWNFLCITWEGFSFFQQDMQPNRIVSSWYLTLLDELYQLLHVLRNFQHIVAWF